MAWGTFEHITVIFTVITGVITIVGVALRLRKWWKEPVPCQVCEGRRVVQLERQLALLQNDRRLSLGGEWTRDTVLVDIERGIQATEGDGNELEDL
ncbi:hypothetical protein N7478_000453 [Penicillium angulare]|uniref:uncharacterized protein n=1 Tax=Penicillium angulare TaxID=116970 RepID=UPI00254157EF|nr:uncharacterized protein N7478_000453 [Penicillium angulare]KAJ5291202.1 hypothetical protein N7478_000453 [Penicillium angulare]